MSKKQRRVIDDDDDGDLRDILADGESMRVPMYRLTDAQRQVAAFAAQNGGNALHRPGFVARDAAGTKRIDDAYASYEADLTSGWQGQNWGYAEPDTGAGVRPVQAAPQVGAACTVRGAAYPLDFGSPGHFREVNGRVECVPDQPRSASPPAPPAAGETTADARRAVADAYATYEKSQCEAWKTP